MAEWCCASCDDAGALKATKTIINDAANLAVFMVGTFITFWWSFRATGVYLIASLADRKYRGTGAEQQRPH
jgi:hypothetical protein